MAKYFKYRSIGLERNGKITKKTLDETIQPLVDSYFYLPTIDKLNDPFEGLFVDNVNAEIAGFLTGVTAIGERLELTRGLHQFSGAAKKFTESSGIFSLSNDPIHELMWAHYGDSHYGMAIEYDLRLLTRFVPTQAYHHFPVTYSGSPPLVGINNLSQDNGGAIRSRLGHKSPAWGYESEYRVAIDNMNGRVSHDYRAVKSITFGARTNDEVVNQIIDLTKHKVVDYYQIQTEGNRYGLERKRLHFSGTQPSKSRRGSIDFTGHLSDVEDELRGRVIEVIKRHLLADPHFVRLNIADVCLETPKLIFVTFDAEHKLGLPPQFESANKLYFSLDTLGIVKKP